MTINYTTLLGLAKPVTGTETGQWGDIVNDEITSLLEDSIAKSVTLNVTSANVTLTTTNGATNQARVATLIITGTPGTTRNIIAPSQSKIYQVINQSDSSVVIKGAATTGVTILAGASGVVAWNGSDFIEIGAIASNRTINGVLQLSTGTVTSPSISPINDANTGLYFPAADTVGVAVGGVNVGNFTSTGFSGNAATATNATNLVNGNATLAAGTVAAPSLTTTGDTNTGLYFPAADTIGVAVGGAQVAEISPNGFAVNGNNISAVNSLGFRNRIINGGMVIDQRNAGAAVTAGSAYTLDRWKVDRVWAGSTVTIQQSSTAPTGFVKSLSATVTTGAASASSSYFSIQQYIEGNNIADMALGTASAKQFTVSFWVRSSVTGTFGVCFRNSVFDLSYCTTYTIDAANTWEQKFVTIAAPTSGTFGTGNSNGLNVIFSLGGGSSVKPSSNNAWVSGNFIAPIGQTDLISTTGATFFITGVQLEAGSVATPFERRDYGRELMMCQRYALVLGGEATNASISTWSPAITSTESSYMSVVLPVKMRAVPSVATSGAFRLDDGYAGSQGVTGVGINTDSANSYVVALTVSVASGLTAGRVYQLQTNGSTASRLTLSSEL